VLAYFVYYTNISVQWAIALSFSFSTKGDRSFGISQKGRSLFGDMERAIDLFGDGKGDRAVGSKNCQFSHCYA